MVNYRRFIGFFVLLAAVSMSAAAVSAELVVQPDKEAYNLGDAVSVDYTFSRDQDFSGLAKLSLECPNYALDFYTLPTTILAGQGQKVTVPPLAVSPPMLGRCYISANATAYDNSINESSISSFFNVTNQIYVSAKTDKNVYLPSGSIGISGEAQKSQSSPASLVMAFLGNNYAIPLANNSFTFTIKLPSDIKSGRHELDFTVNDSFGNFGSASAEFGVEAVPTRLVNTLAAQSVIPGQEFSVSSLVYDQAGDRIQADVAFAVNDSSGNIVLSASGSTGSSVALAFAQGQKPGAYSLVSSALGLVSFSPLVVEEVENVSVSFGDAVVVLKNTGNVNYAKQFNVTLSGRKSYNVQNDVSLAPGEVFQVDLSNAVPTDDYSVGFPTVAGSPSLESVHVDDERSPVKKVFDYLRITGRNVQVVSTGTGRFQFMFAPVLLLVIVALLAFFFVKNKKKAGSASAEEKPNSQQQPDDKRQSSPFRPVSHLEIEDPEEEAKIRRIIEEKHRLQKERNPTSANSSVLRDDPYNKKFVRDMMKDKPMR